MKTPSDIFLACVVCGLVALPVFAFPDTTGRSFSVPAAKSLHRDKTKQGDDNLIEMQVKDVVPLGDDDAHAVMLVSSSGTVLPVMVQGREAVAIAFRLAGREPPHPLAEDLLDQMVKKLGGEVAEVRIGTPENRLYASKIVIRQGRRTFVLEARASDSLSMALASGAEVYATRGVMAESGIRPEEIEALQEGVGGSGQESPTPLKPRENYSL